MTIKVVANEDTMLRTQIFPVCSRARKTHFLCPRHKKCFDFFRNVCPQQMFPGLRSMETKHWSCSPLVCSPSKHHKQQCVLVYHRTKLGRGWITIWTNWKTRPVRELLFSQIFNDHGIVPLQIANDDKEIQQLKADKARLMHEVGFISL